MNGDDANLPAMLETFRAAPIDAEVLFTVAGVPPPSLSNLPHGWRVIQADTEALTPHLWRDGIRAARSERVGLTTSDFLPPANWLAAAAAADLDRWAGVAGPIEAGGRDALTWAVFLLRYRAFAPPVSLGDAHEIPADNAVYRRSAILAHPDLLEIGFWEPSFHARFHAEGLKIGLDPELLSRHAGQERSSTFIQRRFRHGRAFGRARAKEAGRAKAAGYLVASPLLPFLLMGRIAAWAMGREGYRKPLLAATPWLAVFCMAWSLGETFGYLDGVAGAGSRTRSSGGAGRRRDSDSPGTRTPTPDEE